MADNAALDRLAQKLGIRNPSILYNCESLRLNNMGLTSLPAEISLLSGLEYLSTNDNELPNLPLEMTLLRRLRYFGIERNNLTVVPPVIFRLTNLRQLSLCENKLSSLPPEISLLTGLDELSLELNPITELPPQITELVNLQYLYIDFDGIQYIKRAPRGITELPCWDEDEGRDYEQIRALQLYDSAPSTARTTQQTNVVSYSRTETVVTTRSSSRPTHSTVVSKTQTSTVTASRLATSKYADILVVDFEKKENFLGAGGFGLVFKVQLRAGLYAVKVVASAELRSAADGSDPEKEGNMMLGLQHPNILALYEYGFRSKDLLFVMEYADGGDLYSLVKRHKALGNETSLKYGLHIIQGLKYLHTRTPAIQHRDLKTQNVLLVNGVAKLTDFGLSKSGVSVNSVSSFKGSISWSPPEAFEIGKSMGLPSDIYSYGVVIWSMLTGEYPYQDLKDAEIGQRVLSGALLPLPPSSPSNLVALIHKCWERDFESRINAAQVETELNEVIRNPLQQTVKVSKPVGQMTTAELIKYLGGKNAHPDFVATVGVKGYTGEDFVELEEKDLTSAPFNLKKVQARVILEFIQEAKRT